MEQIKTKEELDKLKEQGVIGSGTHNCGTHALKQKKPLFLANPDDKVDWKRFMEDLK